MKKIYTAGFDVFHPDGRAHMEALHALCRKYGFEPEPLGVPKPGMPKVSGPDGFFEKDIEMLDDCDIVAANLNSFRGFEMDCGTAFELGYAYARGKKLYGYMSDTRPGAERYGCLTDENGFRVENYGLPINLMIGCSVQIVEGTLEDCLRVIAARELKDE